MIEDYGKVYCLVFSFHLVTCMAILFARKELGCSDYFNHS